MARVVPINPGGRPQHSLAELRRMCQGDMELCYHELYVMALGSSAVPAKVRLQAIELILAYAVGKPPVTVTGDPDAPIVIATARTQLEAALQRIHALEQPDNCTG